MADEKKRSIPVLSGCLRFLGIPFSFLSGLLIGVAVPLAAIAAIVAGVRLATGKFPFLSHVETGENGERALTLRLVPPDQVKALWAEHKQTLGGELSRFRDEMQAISQEAKSKAK